MKIPPVKTLMIIYNAFATTRWLPHRTTHFALSELLLTLRLEASACSTGRFHFDDGDPYVISSKWKGIVASVVENVLVKEQSHVNPPSKKLELSTIHYSPFSKDSS